MTEELRETPPPNRGKVVCALCLRGLFIGGHWHAWDEDSDSPRETWRIW